MIILSFIWKIIKAAFGLGFWIIRKLLSPIGCVLKLVLIAVVVIACLLIFA